MSDFSSTIARFSSPYTVTRFAAQSFTNGILQANSGTPLPIDAMIAPANGRDLERLPEGTRVSDVIQVFTVTELVCLDEVAKKPADTIAYKGKVYQVEHEDDWEVLGNYHKYVARKVG